MEGKVADQTRGRAFSFSGVIALLASVSACNLAPQSSAPPIAQPDRIQRQVQATAGASTALIRAERLLAVFAELPAEAVRSRTASGAGAPSAAQGAALRAAASRAYLSEAVNLADALKADELVSAGDTDLTRSLTTLARERDVRAEQEDPRAQHMAEVSARLAARSDRSRIVQLVQAMAAPRLVIERRLAARRIALALDLIGREDRASDVDAVSAKATDLIESTRQAEDAQAERPLSPRGMLDDHASLIEALLRLPPADVSTLLTWYASPAGKSARDKMVGAFQGANDRAARVTLIAFLSKD